MTLYQVNPVEKFQKSLEMSNEEENFHKSLEKSNDEVKNLNKNEEKFQKSLKKSNDMLKETNKNEKTSKENMEKSKENVKKLILTGEDNDAKGPSKKYEVIRRKIRRDLDEFWFFVRVKFEQGVQQATCGRGKVRLG